MKTQTLLHDCLEKQHKIQRTMKKHVESIWYINMEVEINQRYNKPADAMPISSKK